MAGRRDYWRADLVALFTAQSELVGGIAYLLGEESGSADHAFAVVDHVSAANFGLARLIGHNLGCETDQRGASRAPVAPYAYGYLQLSRTPYFRTIMGSSAGCPSAGCAVLPYYSTSATNISLSNDGVSFSLYNLGSAGADCSRAIGLTHVAVANYRRTEACAGEQTPAAGVAVLSGHPYAPTSVCPANCNNHGSCDYTTYTCHCRLPWYSTEEHPDCSQRKCPDDCGGHGSCDATSGVCMCAGGWTGKSCAQRVANYCPNDCTSSIRDSSHAPGWCLDSVGACDCRRTYQDPISEQYYYGDTATCEANEGDCYHGEDWSTRLPAARVEWQIGEVGTITTGDARLARPIEVESGWVHVEL
eukprot:SAG11_NODE_5613_length_1508_cov_1.048971_1_plen_359_part_10